jgi:hypothetical protein
MKRTSRSGGDAAPPTPPVSYLKPGPCRTVLPIEIEGVSL